MTDVAGQPQVHVQALDVLLEVSSLVGYLAALGALPLALVDHDGHLRDPFVYISLVYI